MSEKRLEDEIRALRMRLEQPGAHPGEVSTSTGSADPGTVSDELVSDHWIADQITEIRKVFGRTIVLRAFLELQARRAADRDFASHPETASAQHWMGVGVRDGMLEGRRALDAQRVLIAAYARRKAAQFSDDATRMALDYLALDIEARRDGEGGAMRCAHCGERLYNDGPDGNAPADREGPGDRHTPERCRDCVVSQRDAAEALLADFVRSGERYPNAIRDDLLEQARSLISARRGSP
jgi:hypothetical protein